MRISVEGKISYGSALQKISEKVACLELFPYHSKRCELNDNTIDTLKSAEMIKKFVNSYVLKQANRKKAGVIVVRGRKRWGINKNSKNVVVYKGSEARGGFFSPQSKGGEIVEKYLVQEILRNLSKSSSR